MVSIRMSQINGSGQLLNLVEQVVSFLHSVLIKSVSLISGISFDYSRHFVYLAGQSARADQLGQFPIDKVEGNTELIGHGFEFYGLVGLQELGVDDHSGFADEVAGVVVEEGICFDQVDDAHEHLEEAAVSAVVEGLQVLLDVGQLHQVDDGLRGLEDLLLDADSVHVEDASEHAVGDQFFIAHHFGAVEGGDDVDEELAGSGEISDDEPVDALVDLQFVLAFPVAALLEQLIALVNVLLDLVVVLQLEIDADEFEGDVHLLADFDGALESQVVCLDGFGVLGVVVVELGLGQKGVAHFGFAKVLLSVLYFSVVLLKQLLKGFLNVHDLNYFQIMIYCKAHLISAISNYYHH